GDDLVVDLFPEPHQLFDRAALDERECLAATGGDVVAVFRPEYLELGLGVEKSQHVAIGEVVARGQTSTEMHRRRTLDQSVVDVEECGGGQVDRRLRMPFAGLGRGLQVIERTGGAGVGGQRFQVGATGGVRAA